MALYWYLDDSQNTNWCFVEDYLTPYDTNRLGRFWCPICLSREQFLLTKKLQTFMKKMPSNHCQEAHVASPPHAGGPTETSNVSLRLFDTLPDSAHVRLPAVVALFGISRATVWRWVREQKIPAPKHFGSRVSAWNVADLREALRTTSSH